jgi:hypothetical protein
MNEEILDKANKVKKEIERTQADVAHCKIVLNNSLGVIVGSNNTKDYDFRLPDEVRECVMRTALAALENRLDKLRKEFDEL